MRPVFLLAASFALLGVGCGSPPAADTAAPVGPAAATVVVTVVYRERMSVPEGSVVEAELLDASRRSAPLRTVARERIRTAGQPPYRLTIPYDPAAIDPDGLYLVRARILVNGLARFTSDTEYPVITRGGAQDVTVFVRTAR